MALMISDETPHMLQELLDRWDVLRKLLEEALESEDPPGDDQEDELANLRAWLIRRSRVLQHLLGDEYTIHKDLVSVLSSLSSYERIRQDSPIIQDSVRNRWHEVFIAGNKIIGRTRELLAQGAGGKKGRGRR